MARYTSVPLITLYAINADGSLKWKFTTGANVSSTPALGSDGTIYVGSDDNKFYAVNPDGTQKWVFQGSGDFSSGAAIATDGTVYVVSEYRDIYALNPDGTLKGKLKQQVITTVHQLSTQ